jgi:hypothetical protein
LTISDFFLGKDYIIHIVDIVSQEFFFRLPNLTILFHPLSLSLLSFSLLLLNATTNNDVKKKKRFSNDRERAVTLEDDASRVVKNASNILLEEVYCGIEPNLDTRMTVTRPLHVIRANVKKVEVKQTWRLVENVIFTLLFVFAVVDLQVPQNTWAVVTPTEQQILKALENIETIIETLDVKIETQYEMLDATIEKLDAPIEKLDATIDKNWWIPVGVSIGTSAVMVVNTFIYINTMNRNIEKIESKVKAIVQREVNASVSAFGAPAVVFLFIGAVSGGLLLLKYR